MFMKDDRAIYSYSNIKTALSAIRGYDSRFRKVAEHGYNLYEFARFIDEVLIPLNVGIGIFCDHENVSAWDTYRRAVLSRRPNEEKNSVFKLSLKMLEQEIFLVMQLAHDGEVILVD